MTEAAVNDGGAPAPAETGAAIDVEQATHSNPLPSQVPPKADEGTEAPKPVKTTSEAIRAASEALKAKDAAKPKEPAKEPEKAKDAPAAKPEAKEAEKPAQPRENGKFVSPNPPQQQEQVQAPAPVQQSAHAEAPTRFSPESKAAWAQAPEAVRAEAHRAIRELEQGIQKYKADSDEYAELREFRDMAKQHNTSIKTALTNYVGLEKLLTQSPIAGLEKVLQNLNLRTSDGRALTLRDVAAHVLGQKPEEVSARQASTIQELRGQVSRLEQMVGSVTQTIQQQGQRSIASDLDSFMADPKHTRFEELSADIEFFLKSDKVPQNLAPRERLSEAYKLAERLNPAPQASVSPQPVIPAQPAPLNPAGLKSISGNPSAGSDPEITKKTGPIPSIKDALKRASQKAS